MSVCETRANSDLIMTDQQRARIPIGSSCTLLLIGDYTNENTQELVLARGWRFESSLPHQPSLTRVNVSVSYGWQATRRLPTVALAKVGFLAVQSYGWQANRRSPPGQTSPTNLPSRWPYP